MKLAQDAAFRDQRERFQLRFTCEHCALHDPARDACAHGFPTAAHRLARYADPEAPLLFCKDFELE